MTINSKQLTFILDNTPAEQNIMLVGRHGIGKSRILEDYFNAKGAKVVTLFLGQMSDPGDLIGLPEKNEKTGKTDFMLPYWFPIDGEPVVLFLDELNRARPEVLQTIMDLTLNRKLAGKTLPEGSRIISAVNNGNEYQLTDLDPALVSRFNIYEFAPTVEDWISWAKSASLDSRVVDFISENPEFLDGEGFSSETDNLERTPDRRSWERISKIIKNFPILNYDCLALISGILGNKASSLFYKYVNDKRLPGAGEILKGKVKLEEELASLSLSDFTCLNESIWRFLQSETKEDLSSENKALYCKHLPEYFNYLSSVAGKEIVSHFISLIDSKKYPAALNFITLECPEVYKKIMEEIGTKA